MQTSRFGKRWLGVLCVLQLLTGCSSFTDLPPGSVLSIQDGQQTAVLEHESVEVALGAAAVTTAPEKDYRIGPNDVLFINVKGHPDLSSPGAAGGNNRIAGSRVDGKGRVHLPLVGEVAVAGLTVHEARNRLQQAFRTYLQEPWVIVEVIDYRSQSLYLLGQFTTPGTYYMDRPLSLVEGLALGNGLRDSANLRSARLIRSGQTIAVDIYRLLQEGDRDQNTWLQAEDVIYVPDDRNQNVFVFGAVEKPGPVAMPNGRLNLAQALTSAGILEARAQESHVRIIRSLSPTRGELIVVDLNRIMRGQAMPFALMEGDILYVPRSRVGSWNQAIQEILPSLQAISAVLQPFVQIQYLKRN